MGHLPTLGLIKRNRQSFIGLEDGEASEIKGKKKKGGYRESSMVNPNNPFSRENNTEKLLLAKEKERE